MRYILHRSDLVCYATAQIKSENEYYISKMATGIMTITKAKEKLEVRADDMTISYGDEAPVYTVSYEPLGEDVYGCLEGTAAFKCSYKKGKPEGEYTITPSGLTSDNYDITFASGTLTVEKSSEVAKESFIAGGTAKKTTNTIKWNSIEYADGYDIYFAKCGKSLKKTASTTKLSYTKKGLKTGSNYKYVVKAYEKIGGKKKYVASTPTIHIAGSKAKYSNAAAVKATPSKLTMTTGQSSRVKGKITKKSRNRTVLWKNHVSAQIRYMSSDKSIVTVDGKGNIKAKSEGRAYIYAYAANGISARTAVTVTADR